MKKFLRLIDQYAFEIAFVVAAAATLASFVLSNVVDLIPCDLCWWQRILMFPLPLILGAAVLRSDKLAFIYVLLLSIIGAIIALYHALLQWDVIEHSITECSITSGSCSEPEILWLGFLTIPFGAFLSFMAINFLMWRAIKNNKETVFDQKKQKLMSWMVLILGFATIIAVGLVELAR